MVLLILSSLIVTFYISNRRQAFQPAACLEEIYHIQEISVLYTVTVNPQNREIFQGRSALHHTPVSVCFLPHSRHKERP